MDKNLINAFRNLLLLNGLTTIKELSVLSNQELYTKLNNALSRLYRIERSISIMADYNITRELSDEN